jgi:hypothetical protein
MFFAAPPPIVEVHCLTQGTFAATAVVSNYTVTAIGHTEEESVQGVIKQIDAVLKANLWKKQYHTITRVEKPECFRIPAHVCHILSYYDNDNMAMHSHVRVFGKLQFIGLPHFDMNVALDASLASVQLFNRVMNNRI